MAKEESKRSSMDYANRVQQYILTMLRTVKQAITNLQELKKVPIFMPIVDLVLSLYYYFSYGLSPCIVDLDDQTTMNFWVSKHRRHGSPNLVIIHGCGGDARWQFALQMRSLSKSFNIYMPDLLFYGKSYTNSMERSPEFQAKCIMEGLKRGFGVETCSIYAISYGGWVGYRMAEMYPQEVKKILIVSCGIGTSIDQKLEQLKQVQMPIEILVVPRDPEALRLLFTKAIYKYDLNWVPDLFLWESIRVMDDKNRTAKEKLIQHIMSQEEDSQTSTLSQEALLVWGDQDKFFPTHLAYQLQRFIGPNARLEIIEEAGHAVNIDSPSELNAWIKLFMLDNVPVSSALKA